MGIASQQGGKVMDGRPCDGRRADGEIKEDLVGDVVGARAEELFRGAVQRAEEEGVTRQFLARRLGVAHDTLVAWLSPSKAGRHVPWFEMFKLVLHLPDGARVWLIEQLAAEWGCTLVAERSDQTRSPGVHAATLEVAMRMGTLAASVADGTADGSVSPAEAMDIAGRAAELAVSAQAVGEWAREQVFVAKRVQEIQGGKKLAGGKG
jgi:hypothetical protein